MARRAGKLSIFPLLIFGAYAAWFWFSNQETVPITGRSQVVSMDTKQEMALGIQSYRQLLSQERILPDSHPSVQQVRAIGRRIAAAAADIDPGFEWEFNVIESSQANAFALPGGKVAVYTGILPIAENEDGLAVIMGHEISHALARHGAERMAMQKLTSLGVMATGVADSDMDRGQQQMIMGALGVGAQYGLLLPFSRDHESEADYMGLVLLAEACFDPQEAPALWRRMDSHGGAAPPQWQSTHPSSKTRVRQFEQWMPEALALRQEACGF